MKNMPSYYELLKENALLRLEIAEALEILRAASTVNGHGQEVVSSLVSHARNIVDILQAEMGHVDELEKELEINSSEETDAFDGILKIPCVTCGNNLTVVRPGKHQCDYCESVSACHRFGLCQSGDKPIVCCKICPQKEKTNDAI